MSDQLATLGITINADQAIRQVGTLDESLHRLGVTSVAGTQNMNAWGAMQAEVAGHVGKHTLAVGRLEMSLARVVEKAIGVNSAVGMMGAGMLRFGIGSIETVGILAGIAAITSAYEYFTSAANKAAEAQDKLRESLRSTNLTAALGPDSKDVQDTQAERDKNMQMRSRRALLLRFGVSEGDDRILQLNREIIESNNQLEAGEKRIFDARMKQSQLATVTVYSDKKKDDAAAKKWAAEGVALDKEIARLKLEMTLAELSKVADLHASILKEATTYTMPAVRPLYTKEEFDKLMAGADKNTTRMEKAIGQAAQTTAILLGTLLGGLIGNSTGSRVGAGILGGVGGALGTYATAEMGGAMGAAMGSIVPVVGTLVGAVIGSALGGLFGSHKKAVNANTAAIQALTAAMYNQPSGYKVERVRFDASDARKIADATAADALARSRRGGTSPLATALGMG